MSGPATEDAAAERLTGGEVRHRVVSGGVQRAAGFLAVNGLTAATAVLLLRHLGVRDFGRYGTVIALLTIVQGVSDAGLSFTGSRELAVRREESERRALLSHLVALRIILSAVGVLSAVAFALIAGYSRPMIEGTALAGAGVFLLSVQGSLLLPLVVELENGRLALNDVIRQLVLVLCFVALVAAGATLLPFFGAQLVAAVAVLATTPLLLNRRRLVRPRWGGEQLLALARTTLPVAVSSVLGVLYFRILVIMMSLLAGSSTQLGYYVTSARIIEILLGLPLMLVGVVLPVLSVSAKQDPGRLQYVTLRMTQTMCLLGVLAALTLGTGARPIILLLGGHQYLGAVPVLQIQCAALITIFITGGWTTTLIGMNRTRALALGTAVGVAAVAVLGGILIPLWGARGAGAAAVAADIIFCAAIYVPLRRAGAAATLAVSPFLRIALGAVLAVGVAVFLPAPAIVGCVAAVAVFGLSVLLLGAVPPELAQRFPRPLC